ncbi:phage Gp37/Gp68 family protein [Actinoplanes sp. NPDC023936]|uniref:DUF5131 family protein n=1 Tax=Actinoplanes sp. NPDC023936 TaxID=3154910 RepID=UPI0033E55FE5
MSSKTSIEWTRGEDGSAGRTWNPLLGCERVSPGCDGCYAITTATIRAGNPHPKVAAAFAGLTERRDGRLDWTGRINLLPDRLTQPLSWRKPSKVFVNSQSDLFHKDVPDEFIAKVFAVMAATPQHSYQLLTKRHGRMRSLLNNAEWRSSVFLRESLTGRAENRPLPAWPLPNVWLGVSVEDQARAKLRVPALLHTPAAVRWLSCEPLLGPVSLIPWLNGGVGTVAPADLDWVVVGGESGPRARPVHPDWARALRDECIAAGVPYFFKQWGEWAPLVPGVNPGKEIRAYPGALIQRVGKKAAGRELDGRTWDEYPTARTEAAAR